METEPIFMDARFTGLLEAVMSGEASSAEVEELNAWLLRDPAARRVAARRMVLESVVTEGAEMTGGARPLPQLMASFSNTGLRALGAGMWPGKRRPDRRRAVGLAVAAALVVAAGVVWWGAAFRSDPAVAPAVSLVPRVIEHFQVKNGAAPLAGELGFGRRVEIASGILHLRLDEVADCFISGPAAFTFTDREKLVLEHGRVRVRMDERTERFEVKSGDLRVLDMGTEFGVSPTADGKIEVHVFSGEVALDTAAMDKPLSLEEGRAVSVGSGGAHEFIELNPTDFPDQEEIRHRRWLEYRDKMTSTRGLVFFYDFEDSDPTVLRDASRTATPHDGRILGAERVSGRWFGKGALKMNRPGDCVTLEIPGKFESFTLAGWFRIDQPPANQPAVLFSGTPDLAGTARWRVVGGGALQFLSPGSGRRPGWTSPQGLVPNEGWVHLALTVSLPNQRVEMYVDGQRHFSRGLGRTKPAFRFGNSWLGGMPAAPAGNQPFYGSIDEFLMLDRVATADEIMTMYRAGQKGK